MDQVVIRVHIIDIEADNDALTATFKTFEMAFEVAIVVVEDHQRLAELNECNIAIGRLSQRKVELVAIELDRLLKVANEEEDVFEIS